MLSPRFAEYLLKEYKRLNPPVCTCQKVCEVHNPVEEVKNEDNYIDSWTGSAYCVTCKENVEFTGRVRRSDSGRQMAMGNCPRCNTRVNRILGKSSACREEETP